MTEEDDDKLNERHFLHDLCNPLSIAYGGIRLLKMKLDKDGAEVSMQEVKLRIDKALDNFERINKLIDERRNYLKSKPNK